MVGRQLDHGGRQLRQVIGQRGGVAQVGLAIGRADAHQQQAEVADPILRPLQRLHRRVVGGQQLRDGGAQLQAAGQRQRQHTQQPGDQQHRPRAGRQAQDRGGQGVGAGVGSVVLGVLGWGVHETAAGAASGVGDSSAPV